MKVKTLSALAGLGGALIMSSAANAALVGLAVETAASGGGPAPSGGARTIYHVYAVFNNGAGGDRVNAWGVGQDLGAGSIVNLNAAGTGAGTGFTNINPAASTNLAPYSSGSTRDWDTYATIGLRYQNQGPYINGAYVNAVSVISGTPTFIANGATSWTDTSGNGAGYFITPDDVQGRANWVNEGADTINRVLLMQLVVNAGQNVAGTIGVAWNDPTDGGVTTTGLTFSSIIPAPGAMALLGLAGLVGSRRRRG